MEAKEPKNFDPFEKEVIMKVTNEENTRQTKTISEAEVLAAINDLPKNRTPGIDGLPSEFYQLYKKVLIPILVTVFNETLQDKLSDSQRTGAITLIAKEGDKKELKNWRPIALLCVDYKIMAKIVTNRIKKYSTELSDPARKELFLEGTLSTT